MPRMKYKDFAFRSDTLSVIQTANSIIANFAQQGFDLTLRQLYYQFVAQDLIENTMRSYKRLGSIINDGRLAGVIDWDSITDRTRNLRSHSHWDSPADILRTCAYQYKRDKWEGQSCRVEVWVEKDALIDVVQKACSPLDVPHFSCRGYVSQSEMWNAAQRLIIHEDDGLQSIIIHLGDH